MYAVISAIAVLSLPGNALESIVSTQYGRLRGTGFGVVSFKGIPYAAGPTGRLRWRPPEALAEWQGVAGCHRVRTDLPTAPNCACAAHAVQRELSHPECLDSREVGKRSFASDGVDSWRRIRTRFRSVADV